MTLKLYKSWIKVSIQNLTLLYIETTQLLYILENYMYRVLTSVKSCTRGHLESIGALTPERGVVIF